MLSAPLKERLAHYRTLKEEEERNAKGISGPDPPLPGDQSNTNTNTAPGESWVPRVDGADTDNEIEVVVEDTVGRDPNDEYIEEVVEDSDEEESFVESDTTVSFQDAETDFSQKSEQHVFMALDEAERAESFSRPDAGSREQPPEKNETSRSNSKQKCIVLVLVFVACVAIVAIVLPFFIDYRPQKSQSNPTQPVTPVTPPLTPPLTPPVPPPSSNTQPVSPPIAIVTTNIPTDSPTVTPTTLRWGQFMKTFLIPASGEVVFENENSPQYRAAKYILNDPYTQQLTDTDQLHERYASATFYFATHGKNWNSCSLTDEDCTSGRWLVGNVCDWFAVSCNEDGRVISIIFANAEGNGLVGSLPAEMHLLHELNELVIINNTITGTLPEVFGEHATSMRSLLLPDNELEGEIPENYLSNSPLEFVHLGSNAFSGPVPTSLGQASSLQQLDLSRNSMTGTIPEGFSSYTVLEALSLANNRLSGTISEELYDLPSLKFLHLKGNELDGSISTSIANLSSLKELRIGETKLSGYVPDELYALTNLVELDISQALFDGRLSIGLLNLNKLEKLIINNNNFDGTVPIGFGQMSSLTDFALHGNGFSGTVPESVCLLREVNLMVLTASCTELTCDCCSLCF